MTLNMWVLSIILLYIKFIIYYKGILSILFLFNSFEHDFYILCFYKQIKMDINHLKSRWYRYTIKQFLKILRNFKYLEEEKVSKFIYNKNKQSLSI